MKMPAGSPDVCRLVNTVTLHWHSHTYETTRCAFVETCEGVKCSPGKVCKMKTGRPQCVCSPDCSPITRKHAVCGSDGKSYKDECTLLMARCMGHPDLEVMYQGDCKSKPDWSSLCHLHDLHKSKISHFVFANSFFTQSRAPTWCVPGPTPAWPTRPTALTASCAVQLLAPSPCRPSSRSVATTTSLTPAPATSAGPPASWAAP